MTESAMPVEEAPERRSLYAFRKIGRFVYVMQWWMPFILTFWVLFGRGFVGAVLGWLTVVGLDSIGRGLLIALYVPPLLTLGDADVRRSRTTRFGYSVVMCVLWGTVLVGGLLIPDYGDGGPLGSAITTWTGGAVTADASWPPTLAASGIAVVLMLVASGLAVAGTARPDDPTVIERPSRWARPGTVTTAFWLWWVGIAAAAVELVFGVISLIQSDLEYLDSSVPVMVVEVVAIGVGSVFVLRLRTGSWSARIVLSITAVVVLAGVIVGSQVSGFPSLFDDAVAYVLIVATVLLFLPPSNGYFLEKARSAAGSERPPSG